MIDLDKIQNSVPEKYKDLFTYYYCVVHYLFSENFSFEIIHNVTFLRAMAFINNKLNNNAKVSDFSVDYGLGDRPVLKFTLTVIPEKYPGHPTWSENFSFWI